MNQTPIGASTGPSVYRRLAGRFALLAFGLYHLPLVLNDYPSLGGGGIRDQGLAHTWGHVFTPPGVWVARHVLGLTGAMPAAYEGDNGDVGEEFGRLLLGIAIALVASIAWTIADRRKPRSPWVEPMLRLLLRYAIVLGLTSYAVAKLLPVQFPPLQPLHMERHVGDMTPQGLLWTLMSASRPYAFFGGALEMLAIVLLAFRRTATLGALVCLVVATNVAVLDLCYDVPVKLFSLGLAASAAVLVLLDARRLMDVLVLHRAVPAGRPEDPFASPRWNAARWVAKAILVGGCLLSSYVALKELADRQAAGRDGPLYGWWRVTRFDVTDPAPARPPRVWRAFIGNAANATVRLEDDSVTFCRPQRDDAAHTLRLRCASNGMDADLRWHREGDRLDMEGQVDGVTVSMGLRLVTPTLETQPFRWVHE